MSHFLSEDKFEEIEEEIQQCIDNLDEVNDTVELDTDEQKSDMSDILFYGTSISEIRDTLSMRFNRKINKNKIKFKNATKTDINKIKTKLETNLDLLRRVKKNLC